MKRINTVSALAVLAFAGLMVRGVAQQRMIAEQVVAVVGQSMVLLSDVEDMALNTEMERRANRVTSDRDPRCEALETLLLQNMLANQARIDSLPENSGRVGQNVEDHATRLIQYHGSVQAVEAAFNGKTMAQIKRDLRDRYTEMNLAMAMIEDVKSKVSITPSEVEKFYHSINRDSLPIEPEKYVYSHIVVYPASTEAAKLRARASLLELRERVISGERFDFLAQAYSQDPGSKSNGGRYDMMPVEYLQPAFGEALKRMRPGQISEVVETPDGFHIIQLISSNDNLYSFRHILIVPRFEPSELAGDRAKLDSIARAIRSGEITFEEAARQYSDDTYSKFNGGVVTNHESISYGYTQNTTTRFTREGLEGDYQAISRISPGQISDAYSSRDGKGNEMSKIVLLKEVIPAHRANMREDYTRIEQLALADKQEKYYKEWLDKKIDAMYIRIDPRFMNCEFENKSWLKQ